MKTLLLFLLLPVAVSAQIDWPNYSTSFQGDGKEGAHPVLVTAIPYNGIYDGASYGSVKPEKLDSIKGLYAPGVKLPRYIGISYTVDPGNVYFLAPGVHPANADKYEFRVVLDGKSLLLPWSPIRRFVDSSKRLNEFLPNYGFLGGYKTTWGHSVMVDIREKATGNIESTAIVYWRSTHPALRAVYTSNNLSHFFTGKQWSWRWQPDSGVRANLRLLDSGKMQLQPGENTLIFVVGSEVYQRAALEYQLLKDGVIDSAWKANDFDNNIVFLQNLSPGRYTLQLRLRAQQHNVTTYSWMIRPAWYATRGFRFLLGTLIGATVGGVILFFIFLRQRRRTRREKAAREMLGLELGYIRSQLNPHFIFNALNSIQGLVNSQDMYGANRYLADFGALLRDSLATSEKETNPLSRELRILDTYLSLEKLRFGFRYEIVVAPDVPADTTEIPGFLLQPLVENAVKHGVSGLHSEGVIRIQFFRENANFIAEVTDNGKGIPANVPAGYGLRLTRERIRLLNQLSPERPITMEFLPLSDGAIVKLQFKNWWT